MAKIVPSEKAKQGRSGVQVLSVLVAALILAGIAWVAVEFYGKSTAPTTPGQAEQTAPAGDRPTG